MEAAAAGNGGQALEEVAASLKVCLERGEKKALAETAGAAQEYELPLAKEWLYVGGLIDIGVTLLDYLREGLQSDGVSQFIRHDHQLFLQI